MTYPLQASTCCKHFIANELEHWNNSDRQQIDVFVPQQDLVDSYLPSFQDCVTEGKASGIMCSYNQVSFGATKQARAYPFAQIPTPTVPPGERGALLRQRVAAEDGAARHVGV